MRFQDIPRFTQDGTYEIDVFLNTLELLLNGWEKDYGIDFNPDFQRGHVWTEEQQIAYVEFLLRGGKSAKIIYFNSPAFGDFSSLSELDSTLLCVDGLQRLTAVLRFLRNEIKVFENYYSEYTDSPRIYTALKFNVNCLTTRKEVLEWYLQLNGGGTVHTTAELDRVRQLLDEC